MDLTMLDQLGVREIMDIPLLAIYLSDCPDMVAWISLTDVTVSRDRNGKVIFQLTWSFQLHYGLRVDSAYNRNEYQESSWE
jgi:hypothetical protein